MCGSFRDTWQNGLFYRQQIAYNSIYWWNTFQGYLVEQIVTKVVHTWKQADMDELLNLWFDDLGTNWTRLGTK